ncbi:BTAD domain-containing putative transcriptional regulator [Streptomyces aquilus]|uniref:AfsR/SARP family transcriptional regulator n=1 Tax=Streptomyces aquilus TaxID=2548456 RepID=UPI0036A8E1EB
MTIPYRSGIERWADRLQGVGVKYHVLGSLRVVDGDDEVFINATKIKTVLANLLIRANQVVPFDHLMVELWGENPPRRASAAIHVYVSQLRKLLKSSGCQKSPIITRAPGYLIQVNSRDFDLNVFMRLIEEARAGKREQRHQEVIDLAREALDLWREPVLSDLRESPTVARFSTWLEELRTEFIEMMIDSYLALGRDRESVSYLYSVLQDHPLHETFYQQLMIALHKGGRTGDALQVYQSARETLRNELGLEPGRALRDLQQHILRVDDGHRPRLAASRSN